MPGMRRGAWYAQSHMLDAQRTCWDGDDDDIDDDLDVKARPFSAGSTVDLGESSTPSSYDFEEDIAAPVTPRESQSRSGFAKRLADALQISQLEPTSPRRVSGEKLCGSPPRASGRADLGRATTAANSMRSSHVVGDAPLRPGQQQQPSPYTPSDGDSPSLRIMSPRRMAMRMTMKPTTPAAGSPTPHAPLTPRTPGGSSSGPRPPTRRVFQMRRSHDGLAAH